MSTDNKTNTALVPVSTKTLGAFLGQGNVKSEIAKALPRHISADRMIRVAITAAAKNPKILQCTYASITLSLLNASQLGLEPNGRDAHLVPYWNSKLGAYECQLLPDYKGLIQLAYRSGQLNNFTAKAVYEKDIFEYEFGTDEHIRHIPCTEDDPGQLVYAWAMVRFKDGGSKFVVLNRRDIKRRRDKSQTASREDSVWNQHPEAMWAKSAAKELSKWIPQTPEFQQFHAAVERDNATETGKPIIDAIGQPADDALPPKTRSEALADELASRRESKTEPESAPSGPEPEVEQKAAPETTPANADEMTQEEKDDADQWREILSGYMTIGEVTEAEKKINPSIRPILQAKLHELCAQQIERIRNTRGERAK